MPLLENITKILKDGSEKVVKITEGITEKIKGAGEEGLEFSKEVLAEISEKTSDITNIARYKIELNKMQKNIDAEVRILGELVFAIYSSSRKTKFEVQALQEGAMNIASLTLQMMEDLIRRKYWLRMNNILQYYSMPSRKKNGKKQFKYIEVENTKLTNGKNGTRKIQIVDNKDELMSEEELSELVSNDTQSFLPSTEQRVEAITLTRDYLMNKEFDLEVRIVPNSSVRETDIERKNKNIQFYTMTRQDPLFDAVAHAKSLAEAFDKPEDIVKEPQQGPSPE